MPQLLVVLPLGLFGVAGYLQCSCWPATCQLIMTALLWHPHDADNTNSEKKNVSRKQDPMVWSQFSHQWQWLHLTPVYYSEYYLLNSGKENNDNNMRTKSPNLPKSDFRVGKMLSRTVTAFLWYSNWASINWKIDIYLLVRDQLANIITVLAL